MTTPDGERSEIQNSPDCYVKERLNFWTVMQRIAGLPDGYSKIS